MKIVKIKDVPSAWENGGNWRKIVPEEKRSELNADILQFDEPSQYGIDGGRISKLCITNKKGEWLANYDRGWDVKPSEEIKDFYEEIIEQFN